MVAALNHYHQLTESVARHYIGRQYVLWDPATDTRESVSGSAITVVVRDWREDNANSPVLGGQGSFGRQLQVFIRPGELRPKTDYVVIDGAAEYPIRAVVPWPMQDPTYYQLIIEQTQL